MKNRIIYTILILILIQSVAGADIYSKYLKEANSLYIIKEYSRAFNRIKFVLRSIEDPTKMPVDIKKISEKIYYAYYKELLDKEEYKTIESTFKKDVHFIYLSSSSKRLKLLTEYFDNRWKLIKEQERLSRLNSSRQSGSSNSNKGLDESYKRALDLLYVQSRKESELFKELDSLKDERLEMMRQEERAAFLKIQEQLIKDRKEIESRSHEQFGRLMESLFDLREAETANNSRLFTIISLSFGGVTLILCALFIILTITILRNSRSQQRHLLELTMLTAGQKEGNLSLPFSGELLEPVYVIEDKRGADEQKGRPKELPMPLDRDKERLKLLIEQCRSYSLEIDRATNRKNGSKNVAELVYKISIYLGYSELEAMIYYGAALVYDIGFLNLELPIPGKGELSRPELEQLKKHTASGSNMIHFVDERYRAIFRDAISKHHENIDGSGYPLGMNGNSIPYIARVLRVTDSFVSMISSRDYKQITDKETALERLKSESKWYDKEVLTALESII